MAVQLGSELLCCNHTQQFLYLHWCLNFDNCDERHCAEPISSCLATQAIALGVPTQQLVVNKRLIIHNSAVPGRPPNGTCACGEPGSVLLNLPRNPVCWSLRARDISPRAKAGSLLRHQHQQRWNRVADVTTRKVACLQVRHLQSGLWNRRPTRQMHQSNRESERGEHPTVSQAADSSSSK